MKRYISLFIVLILLMSSICSVELSHAASPKEFRAVWVSTVVNLDYPSSATTNSAALKSEADSILNDIKDMGMTAVILQVRPASDSLYPSDLFPWSQYLTGTQGIAPKNNFDVLDYWIEKAHSLDLELHAWINPYRVAMNKTAYNSLADNHPAKSHPEWVVAHSDGRYYFDPGIPQVQQLVLDGAMEIVENYDIDGLHMDDYFYPDASFDDSDTFAQYGDGFADVGDWRRDNVNRLVKKLYDEIKSAKKNVAFGISPAGIWANKSSMAAGSNTNGNETYFSHFADTRKWVKEGWLDYICPQIYWEIGHSKADYKTLANWWADTVKGSSVKLYIGMSDYQAGAKSGVWKGIDEIKRQLALNATRPEIKGEAHFRYRFIRDNTQLFDYYKKQYTGQKPTDKEEDATITLTTPVHVTGLKTDEHIPYMQGDGDLFMPAKTMTRAEASVMLARLMTDDDGNLLFEDYKGKSSFDDIPRDAWYASAVALMEETGIMKGFDDGEFKPLNNLTRGEFAAIASRFTDMQKLSSSGFADADKHWSKDYVANAVHYGFINGYDDGTFKPANSLTRSEAVAIMNRMLGRTADKEYIDKNVKNPYSDVSSGYWAYYYIMEASTKHHYGYADGEEFWSDKVVTPTPPPSVDEEEPEDEPEEEEIPEEEPFVDYNEIKYPFVADDFEFVRPDLRPNGRLEQLDLSKVDTIAFHHMAHPTADFEAVLNGHHDNGWVTIGYNFWIGFDGRIYVGRGWNVPAAITSHNYHTINIGFQGDYETYNDEMPAAQLNAAKKLVRWLATTLDSFKYIGGHGDVGPTACPGSMFPYDEIIEDARSLGLTDLRSLDKNPFKKETPKEEPDEIDAIINTDDEEENEED